MSRSSDFDPEQLADKIMEDAIQGVSYIPAFADWNAYNLLLVLSDKDDLDEGERARKLENITKVRQILHQLYPELRRSSVAYRAKFIEIIKQLLIMPESLEPALIRGYSQQDPRRRWRRRFDDAWEPRDIVTGTNQAFLEELISNGHFAQLKTWIGITDKDILQTPVIGDCQTIMSLLLKYADHKTALKIFELLTTKGLDIHQVKPGCNTLLMDASKYSRKRDLVKIFIDKANLDEQNKNGETALMLAAQHAGDTSTPATVKMLIEAGAKLDIQGRHGYGPTALILAAQHAGSTSTPATVEMLIKAGANLDLQGYYGMTALMLAAQHAGDTSTPATVEMLIKAGANLDLQDGNGYTALMRAAQHAGDTSTPATVEMLIKAGANLDLQDQYGETALMLAAQRSGKSSNPATVEMLIKAGAKLDLQRKSGSTALMLAAQNAGNTSTEHTVEMLIKAGAKLDLQDKDGWTALMLAAQYAGKWSTSATVEILIKAKAKLDLQNKNGYTALMLAARYSGNTSTEHTVDMLIKAGAKLDLQSQNGSTALIWASQYAGKSSTPETVRRLIEAGAKLDIQNINGDTALIWAAVNTKLSVKTFIKAGARIDLQSKGGFTPLMLAAKHNAVRKVEMLVEAGAKLDQQSKRGATPLMLAAVNKNAKRFEILRILIDAGAKVPKNKTAWGNYSPSRDTLDYIRKLTAPTAEYIDNQLTLQKCLDLECLSLDVLQSVVGSSSNHRDELCTELMRHLETNPDLYNEIEDCTCDICGERMFGTGDQLGQLKCGHLFHRICLEEYYDDGKNLECPNCGEPFRLPRK